MATAGDSTAVLRFVDVHKSFEGRPVLRGVSLAVGHGEVHFILGESGVGKSVLIKQVVGLLRPDRGRVELDGVDVTGLDEPGFFPVRRRCQMIFQHATLFDGLSVVENVAMPIRKRFAVSRREARRRALEALALVNAEHWSRRSPAELGAGVRKRIAIARALALQPQTLLYDEPTTGLDPVSARRTDQLIRDMADRLGVTSVVVSHDLASLRAIGDRVSFLHDGVVRFEGTADELLASDDAAVRRFVAAGAYRLQGAR